MKTASEVVSLPDLSGNPSPSPAELFYGLFNKVHRLERGIASSLGVTPQLGQALLYLLEERPCCVRKLSQLLETQPTSTSKLLSRLDSMGFVTRSLDAVDRRVERVELTATGQAKAEYLREVFNSFLSSRPQTDYGDDSTSPGSLAQFRRLQEIMLSIQNMLAVHTANGATKPR
ncbi:MAG: MarR family winged helix-turn-helix transcriptional regulator [Bacteroidota bacterium]